MIGLQEATSVCIRVGVAWVDSPKTAIRFGHDAVLLGELEKLLVLGIVVGTEVNLRAGRSGQPCAKGTHSFNYLVDSWYDISTCYEGLELIQIEVANADAPEVG